MGLLAVVSVFMSSATCASSTAVVAKHDSGIDAAGGGSGGSGGLGMGGAGGSGPSGTTYPCVGGVINTGTGGVAGTGAPEAGAGGTGGMVMCAAGEEYCFIRSMQKVIGALPTHTCKGLTGALAACVATPTCACVCSHGVFCLTECSCTDTNGYATVSCLQI
jgi:hypothetical protein